MRRRLSAPSSGRAGFAGAIRAGEAAHGGCVAHPKRRSEDGAA
jgi:hypothetical protein